jgi:hypothetical protein
MIDRRNLFLLLLIAAKLASKIFYSSLIVDQARDTYGLDLRVKDLVAVFVGQHISSRIALTLSDQEYSESIQDTDLMKLPNSHYNVSIIPLLDRL